MDTKHQSTYVNPKRLALQPQRKEIDKLVGLVRSRRQSLQESKDKYRVTKDLKLKKSIANDELYISEKRVLLKTMREDYYSKLHSKAVHTDEMSPKKKAGNYILTFVGLDQKVYDRILRLIKKLLPGNPEIITQ